MGRVRAPARGNAVPARIRRVLLRGLSARARLGYIFLPNLLAYGTGGAGWGHTTLNATGVTTDAIDQFGWTAGAGLEYKLLDHLLLRAEYLHYDFGKTSVPVFGDNLTETVNVVRGGLSYRF